MSRLRFILPFMFSLIIMVGVSSPAFAQTPKITIEPQITTIEVGDYFEVKVWIRDISSSNAMVNFQLIITWDPSLIQFNGHSVNSLPNWGTSVHSGITNDGLGYFVLLGDASSSAFATSEDRYWETFSFECLGPGSGPLNLPSTITDENGSTTYDMHIIGDSSPYSAVTTVKGAVNQYELAPVGGVASQVNKLIIIAPYAALAGLIIAVSSIYVIKKRNS
jgi:hypothetical protein